MLTSERLNTLSPKETVPLALSNTIFGACCTFTSEWAVLDGRKDYRAGQHCYSVAVPRSVDMVEMRGIEPRSKKDYN